MKALPTGRLRDRLRIVEAAFLFGAYPLVTYFVSVPRLLGLTGIAVLAPEEAAAPAAAHAARAVGRAVEVAALRLPWRPLCLPQAVVAGLMLRRRGYDAWLCFGARRGDDGLSAHAWLVLPGPGGGIVCGGAPVAGLSPFGHLPEMQAK